MMLVCWDIRNIVLFRRNTKGNGTLYLDEECESLRDFRKLAEDTHEVPK
jgi:hypothetical protein